VPALTASALIELWEHALPAAPIDRASVILTAAWPELSAQDVAALPIGARDRLLLTLRAAAFGPVLEGKADCPGCGGAIELMFDIATALEHPAGAPALSLDLDGRHIACRLPSSADVAAIVEAGLEGEAAERFLVERCLEEAGCDALSDRLVAVLSEAMAVADPWSELILAADCPACRSPAELVLDPLTALWAEIEARAYAQMWAVARLATAFGWREADILAMSNLRRRSYLAMAAT
jgi:hypothetical protein